MHHEGLRRFHKVENLLDNEAWRWPSLSTPVLINIASRMPTNLPSTNREDRVFWWVGLIGRKNSV